jgi:SAM-dependent methyltransferase
MDYLYSQVGFGQDSVIADIGSGTGIFSRLLLERNSFIYCVEPNSDMRQIAENDLMGFKQFVSIDAPAENTGLADNSVDFVTTAQAFHWFDKQMFKTECQRILKPGGKVAIIWNTRDYSSELFKKEYFIREKYHTNRKGMDDGGKMARDWSDFFVDGLCEHKTCRNDIVLDHASYIGINLSRSWAPQEEQDPIKYKGLVHELSELFDEHNKDGVLVFPYFTQCYLGMMKDGEPSP